MRKPKEINSVVVKEEKSGRYKMFCTCGVTAREAKEIYYCSNCNKKADVVLDEESNYKQIKMIQSGITRGKNYIEFKSIIRIYEPSDKRFSTRDERFNVKFNSKTGELNVKWLGDTDLSSYVFQNSRRISYWKAQNLMVDAYHHDQVFQQFIDEMITLRDINPKILNHFIEEKNMPEIFNLFHVPTLQYVPWDQVWMDKDNINFLRKLTNEKSIEEICQTLFGHHSKKIRRMVLEDTRTHDILMIMGPLIKNMDTLLKIIENFKEFRGKGNGRPYPLCMRYRFYDDYIEKGANFLSKLYDEKTWVYQLMKKFGEEFWQFLDYIGDIGRLHETILSLRPEYEFKKTRYIVDLHDLLSKDISRLEHENHTIQYNEDELKLEHSNEEYEIKLAKDTHELVDIGKDMNICVGGYGTEALRKDCFILTIQDKNKYKACLEVRDRELVQAKLERNDRPDEKYKEIIVDWAKKKRIKYSNCYDL